MNQLSKDDVVFVTEGVFKGFWGTVEETYPEEYEDTKKSRAFGVNKITREGSALISTCMFGKETQIKQSRSSVVVKNSIKCSSCGKELTLKVKKGNPVPSEGIFYHAIMTPKDRDYVCFCDTCNLIEERINACVSEELGKLEGIDWSSSQHKKIRRACIKKVRKS